MCGDNHEDADIGFNEIDLGLSHQIGNKNADFYVLLVLGAGWMCRDNHEGAFIGFNEISPGLSHQIGNRE